MKIAVYKPLELTDQAAQTLGARSARKIERALQSESDVVD
jgi:hypothetical protein